MKEVCDLDPEKENYGWCFDCVPEENSLYFEVNGVRFELPSVDLVLLKTRELLGEPVEARFGKDFPIRFDFLDTVGGGNLSVQYIPRHNSFAKTLACTTHGMKAIIYWMPKKVLPFTSV